MESENSKIDVFSINHKRTFCYIEDAVNAIQKLSESQNSIGKTYNIGDEEEEITMEHLSKKIIEIVGKPLVINPLPSTPGSPERRCPSISKLQRDISYNKKFSLDKGLGKTFQWYNKFVFSGSEKYAI